MLVVDLAVIAMVMAASYHFARDYLTEIAPPTFIGWELRPAVMFGCGYGLVEPAGSPAVDAFVSRQVPSIDCGDFASGGSPTPAIGIALSSRYSLYGAGLAMRAYGVSWQTLDAYLAVLFAFSIACIYGVYRMAVGRVLAALGVAMLACSPFIVEIAALRDFAKLPCFAALWLVLAWTIRRGLAGRAAATILPMALAGALLGLGIGVRMDALVLVPVFVAVTMFAVPGFSRRQWGLKAAASLVFALTFLVTGGPILRTMSAGSNSAHVVMLGLMAPFDAGLGIEPAPYDVGAHYSDGFAFTVVASHGLLAQGAQLPIGLGSAKYDAIGGELLGTLARQFPADIPARAIGATLQILRFPFDWRVREQSERLPTFQDSESVQTIVEWRTWVLGAFEGRELAMGFAVLALASAFSWRLGPLGFLLTLYLCGYSMLQFSRRHVFHLDVIPVFLVVLTLFLPVAIAVRVGSEFRRGREHGIGCLQSMGREFATGVAVLAGLLLVVAGTLGALRWWQQGSVEALLHGTLAAQWAPARVAEEPLADTILENGSPVASWYEVYRTDPRGWREAVLLRLDGVVPYGDEPGAEPDLRQRYYHLIADGRCGASSVTVALKYSGAGVSYDYEYTRAFTVAVKGQRTSHVLVPAYYHLGSSWNRFDGFAVPAEQRPCVTHVLRAAAPSSLPLPVIYAALGPDWREQPLYQRIQSQPRVTAAGTPVAPRPAPPDARGSGWHTTGRRALEHTAPSLDAWEAVDGVTITQRGDTFDVASNGVVSGYQLVSPPLDVQPGRTLSVQIEGRVQRGEICVGVLDGAQQQWLLAPTESVARPFWRPPRQEHPLMADTGAFTQARVVFTNCARPGGLFEVRAVTYQVSARP